ncbi:MAG TPA: Uma2 family endonuclease [Anaerolineae bacterium]|nr:Uma2 family endonuclease [Anaerolineae bacterium]
MSFDGSMTEEREEAAGSTGPGVRRANGGDVPPLVAGDHLSRVEFERRYQAMPHVKRAELVEGMEAALGGNCRFSEDGFVEASPELVVEVAASSAAYDLHSKLQAYQRNNVQEYLALLTYERRIAWHELTTGSYVPIQLDDDGILRSRVFPGLWLDADRLWADDLTGLLAVLRAGLASPQHAEFVARYSSVISSNPTAIK